MLLENIDKESKNPISLSKKIDKMFLVTSCEKFKNAEVATPRHLRKKMLDSFPESFWKNKNNKVFEPTSGKGVFVLSIVNKFLKGLKSQIPEFSARYKYIVENCIFWNDINKNNVEITKKLLDPLSKYTLRYSTLDSLTIIPEKTFGIPGFNAVIGNPPYNPSSGTNTGKSIWQFFVEIALDKWLLPKGYLCYVHPNGWRKPQSPKSRLAKLYHPMVHYNWMIHLEMHDIKDGINDFACGTRYDWYLIQKITPEDKFKTKIVDYKRKTSNVSLKNFTWIPNYNIRLGRDITNKASKLRLLQNGSAYSMNQKYVKDTTSEPDFKYKCVHTIRKDGIRYVMSSRNDKGHFGESKIIVALANPTKPIDDYEGKYCVTTESIGILIETREEGAKIIKALKSRKFSDNLESFLFRNYALDRGFFLNLNKDFYKVFI